MQQKSVSVFPDIMCSQFSKKSTTKTVLYLRSTFCSSSYCTKVHILRLTFHFRGYHETTQWQTTRVNTVTDSHALSRMRWALCPLERVCTSQGWVVAGGRCTVSSRSPRLPAYCCAQIDHLGTTKSLDHKDRTLRDILVTPR